MDENGVLRGSEGTLRRAREVRDGLDPRLQVYVVREDRTVVPDGVPDTHGEFLDVVDASRVHESLRSAGAIMTGEAYELDARRPHPPGMEYLYDVAGQLRYRAERVQDEIRSLTESGVMWKEFPDGDAVTDGSGLTKPCPECDGAGEFVEVEPPDGSVQAVTGAEALDLLRDREWSYHGTRECGNCAGYGHVDARTGEI